MPNASVRDIDTRSKHLAYLLTYSQTKMEIDYVYQQLLKLQFPITEVVVSEHVDGGKHIKAILVSEKGKRRRLSSETAMIGGERPHVRGFGSKACP